MPLRFFNTLTKKKEIFKPIGKKEVRMYTCGPTVYNYTHVGNFRTFIFQDLLRRWLEYRGYKVLQVMNITDVDERTIERAKRKKVELAEIVERYTQAFFEDLEALNIEKAEFYPCASEHIEDMADIAKRLLKRGYAFKTEDTTIYYDITKFDGYGRLSGLFPRARLRAKTKREDYKVPKHFALWKPRDEMDAKVFWNTELGRGRPGWHVECSALALKHLGDRVDISSGGVDLIFPHHENTIAVSEAVTGKKFTNYWLHCEHLLVDGKKMSKSLGNFYTLRDLLKKGHDPMAVRLALLETHYRRELDFTMRKLERAEKKVSKLLRVVEKLNSIKKGKNNKKIKHLIIKMEHDFTNAMDDDLDISKALEAFFGFIGDIESRIKKNEVGRDNAREIYGSIARIDSVLGLDVGG